GEYERCMEIMDTLRDFLEDNDLDWMINAAELNMISYRFCDAAIIYNGILKCLK
ncbi:MAG: hypothetical protein MHPSP_004249, partial [Paramarteilia canceri]